MRTKAPLMLWNNRWFFAAGTILVSILLLARAVLGADRLILWKIANEQCVAQRSGHRLPEPCLSVWQRSPPKASFVILKDLVGDGQVLAIAVDRISGIESPEVLKPAIGELWLAAWHARHFVAGLLDTDLTDDAIGLAINSSHARSQDQLHIHVDCVSPEVRDLLRGHLDELSDKWSSLGFLLLGKRYQAIRLSESEFAERNVFTLVASSSPEAAADMGAETVVVSGATFPDGSRGFIVLEDRADRVPGDRAHGEDLLDHTCKIATPIQ
jgi:CDP-diacylglycerol pyrophosphatase